MEMRLAISLSADSVRMATTIITVIPVMLVYPARKIFCKRGYAWAVKRMIWKKLNGCFGSIGTEATDGVEFLEHF